MCADRHDAKPGKPLRRVLPLQLSLAAGTPVRGGRWRLHRYGSQARLGVALFFLLAAVAWVPPREAGACLLGDVFGGTEPLTDHITQGSIPDGVSLLGHDNGPGCNPAAVDPMPCAANCPADLREGLEAASSAVGFNGDGGQDHGVDDEVQGLVTRYPLSHRDLVLLLHRNGTVTAHSLGSGHWVWGADTGGSILSAVIDRLPSQGIIETDPFAFPLHVEGDMLFARLPVMPAAETAPNTTAGGEAAGGGGTFLHYFMNISTLMRRRYIRVNHTDLFATSTVNIFDLDANTGLDVASHSKLGASLQPHLHVVRYDIHIHAKRGDAYSWRVNVAHFKLTEMSSSTASSTGNDEREPRFMSRLLPGMLNIGDDATKMPRDADRTDGANTDGAENLEEDRGSCALLDNFTVAERIRILKHQECAGAVLQKLGLPTAEHQRSAMEVYHGDVAQFAMCEGGVSGHFQLCFRLAGQVVSLWPQPAVSSGLVAAFVWVEGSSEVHRVPVQSTFIESRVHFVDGSGLVRFNPSREQIVRDPYNLAAPNRDVQRDTSLVYVSPDHHALSVDDVVQRLARHHQSRHSGFDPADAASSSLIIEPPADPMYDLWDSDAMADVREDGVWETLFQQCVMQNAFDGVSGHPSDERIPGTNSNLGRGGTYAGLPASGVNSPDRLRGSYTTGRKTGELQDLLLLLSQSWTRRSLYILFQSCCFVVSLVLICFGIIPRKRLRSAWAQVDALMDGIRSSRPTSSRLAPLDMTSGSPANAVALPRHNQLVLAAASVNGDGIGSSDTGGARGEDQNVGSRDTDHDPGNKGFITDAATGSDRDASTESDGENWWRMGSRRQDHHHSHSIFWEAGAGESVVSDVGMVSGAGSGHAAYMFVRDGENGSGESTVEDSDSETDFRKAAQSPHQQHTLPPRLFQQHFQVIEKIGHGGEGCVFCVEHRVTKTKYAIKVIWIHEDDGNRCIQEAVLHSSFDCPHVVRFYYCWIEDMPQNVAATLNILDRDDETDLRSDTVVSSDDFVGEHISRTGSMTANVDYRMLFIQMEYFKNGTLADFFRSRNGYGRKENLEYLAQIAEGLRYLHRQDVVHRDLKPTNIFVTENRVMKIGDFGLAKKKAGVRYADDMLGNVVNLAEDERTLAAGSPLYCSPEQLEGKTVTHASDIFSFGMIILEFYCVFTTLHERYLTLQEARSQRFPADLLAEFPEEMELVRSMVCEHAATRPTSDKVLSKLKDLIKREGRAPRNSLKLTAPKATGCRVSGGPHDRPVPSPDTLQKRPHTAAGSGQNLPTLYDSPTAGSPCTSAHSVRSGYHSWGSFDGPSGVGCKRGENGMPSSQSTGRLLRDGSPSNYSSPSSLAGNCHNFPDHRSDRHNWSEDAHNIPPYGQPMEPEPIHETSVTSIASLVTRIARINSTISVNSTDSAAA